MAKASVSKNFKISATGILSINEDGIVSVEVEDTGELRELSEIFADFKDKTVKLACTYDEDF